MNEITLTERKPLPKDWRIFRTSNRSKGTREFEKKEQTAQEGLENLRTRSISLENKKQTARKRVGNLRTRLEKLRRKRKLLERDWKT